MAKIIYACRRQSPFSRMDESRLRKICERLVPDNLSLPVSHTVSVNGMNAFAIINDLNAVVDGNSVLLGCLYGKGDHWAEPGAPCPDGSFALFRDSMTSLEAATDAAASRSIWYCINGDIFVASTSQRAIVMFLGSFQFNEQVTPWMLSTGALGPGLSWDKRIKQLPPDSSVVLDKKRWSLSVHRHPVVFSPTKRSHSEHRALLTDAIRTVIHSLNQTKGIDFENYVLPLSGGYDSRGILCFLSERGVPANLRTITWGLEENLAREGNDAAVAKELASRIGVRHRYHHTDIGAEPLESVIDRFIHCGEGRVDHLAGYLDGLEIWRKLLEEERCAGIIRGDEGFGWVPVTSELTTRLSVGIGLCGDYRNLDGMIEKFRLPAQALPADLQRSKGETLSAWRDRLYHTYRMPTILAALSDIKYSYVEIINPLLARSILHLVRELPDRLRTEKILFKEIVDSISPAVRYANAGANASPSSILKKREIVELMRNAIQSEEAKQVFNRDFLDDVLRHVRHESSANKKNGEKPLRWLKSLVPPFIKNLIRDLAAKPSLDGNVLAFRVLLILRMHQLLNADCEEMSVNGDSPDTENAAPIFEQGIPQTIP